MPKNITLYFKIPLNEKFIDPDMYFKKWIPTDVNPIIVYKYSYKLTLHIDEDCISSLNTDYNIETWSNISINAVKIQIEIKDINDELASFIFDERENKSNVHHGVKPDNYQYNNLNNEFNELGLEALNFSYEVCNKLITYVRNEKGQYWLELISFEENTLRSLYCHLDAKVKIDNGELFYWSPSSIDSHIIHYENMDFLGESDWSQINEFITSRKKGNLVNELLSNSCSFLKYNHAKSAVIEAVTALETALLKFSIKPDLTRLEFPSYIGRLDTDNIETHVSQFGFAKSIGYLLPILFKEEILPTELIDKCTKAIGSRNAIVHQGQDINLNIAKNHILALKQCSEVLMKYTIV